MKHSLKIVKKVVRRSKKSPRRVSRTRHVSSRRNNNPLEKLFFSKKTPEDKKFSHLTASPMITNSRRRS